MFLFFRSVRPEETDPTVEPSVGHFNLTLQTEWASMISPVKMHMRVVRLMVMDFFFLQSVTESASVAAQVVP